MALQYIRFTELDPVSSVAAGDILPVVETITNQNKKININDLNLSLPVGKDTASLKSASANWQNSYTNLNLNSANWQGTYSSVNSSSSNWNNTYTTVGNNSAGWESVEASVLATSANWNSNYTTTNINSAKWESVYSSYNTASATAFGPFTPAGIASNGTQGLVPAPQGGDDNANLAGDGTFHLNAWDQANASGRYSATLRFYYPFHLERTTELTTNVSFVNTIHLVPFALRTPVALSALALADNNVATPGVSAKVAIYKWRTQYGKPRVTDLVSSSFQDFDLSSTGTLISRATNVLNLPRGLYFVTLAFSAATNAIRTFQNSIVNSNLLASVDWGTNWPFGSFHNTPVLQMATVGTSYNTLWPASLSPNSSTTYDLGGVDSRTYFIFMLGNPY